MATASEVLAVMQAVAPPGRRRLDQRTTARLRELTRSLIEASQDASAEHARFLDVGTRGLCLPEAELTDRLRDATVLVTGGTGCIGSALLAQLAARGPARLVSVSRGRTRGYPRHADVEYLAGDVRDRAAMDRLIGQVRPDVVFHVAAQRDPGLAEVEVHRTVSTNTLGTHAVLAAAAEAGVPQVVCASTGKALRPYSPDMYTASKRAAEWVAAEAASNSPMLISAARFTHVVDNSIIYSRLLSWAAQDEGVIRLHSQDIGFYVQSALESAQLLLFAFLGGQVGELRMHAIADLGWPFNLLELALGVVARDDSAATPVYISGYDRGYEEIPFPGLYDPMTAGDISPLLNAFEAASMTDSPCPMVDAFRVEMTPDPAADKLLAALAETCDRTTDAALVRDALDELSWVLLDCTLRASPAAVLQRSAELAQRHGRSLGGCHRRMLEVIQDHAAAAA